jgi:2,3-diketo-5-methylthio-1-phosphopentane phosphatase
MVACDFDGTVSAQDVTDCLLERFALPDWERLEDAWKAGRLSSKACMAGQVQLLRCTPEQLDEAVDAIAIDPDFPEFAALCQALGVPLAVVSDGLDRAIHRILGRHGLGHLPVIANRLHHIGGERWCLKPPAARTACRARSGVCKCSVIAGLNGPRAHQVLLIGDGASDFCAAADADFVFAKKSLVGHCRGIGQSHVAIAGFAEALQLLPRLLFSPDFPATSQLSPSLLETAHHG